MGTSVHDDSKASDCSEGGVVDQEFRRLQNALRVARSRLKARTIGLAERVYREQGGVDWNRVRRLLRAIL